MSDSSSGSFAICVLHILHVHMLEMVDDPGSQNRDPEPPALVWVDI